MYRDRSVILCAGRCSSFSFSLSLPLFSWVRVQILLSTHLPISLSPSFSLTHTHTLSTKNIIIKTSGRYLELGNTISLVIEDKRSKKQKQNLITSKTQPKIFVLSFTVQLRRRRGNPNIYIFLNFNLD